MPTPDRSTVAALEQRLDALVEKGVHVPDPRQVYLGPEVLLDRIHPGAQLHPGTRLTGADTLLGPGAVVGSEGPAALHDVAMGQGAEVASGFVTGTVLLAGARLGANAHVRACTILEEDASTAHAVGLKQTVLMSFVTMGSLINFCDGLLAGGTSRSDHTEIGSGFIHFNFTPWGASGDKATPTLVGDVPRGALLGESRVFLGGLSGMVGPRQIGFGALTPAGQVIRRDVAEDRVSAAAPPVVDMRFERDHRYSSAKHRLNIEFLRNLSALRAWYANVRRPPLSPAGAEGWRAGLIDVAIRLIDGMVAERRSRLASYLKAHGLDAPQPGSSPTLPCPVAVGVDPRRDHVAWVRALSADHRTALEAWLRASGDAAWPLPADL